jgi:hypothetical protein
MRSKQKGVQHRVYAAITRLQSGVLTQQQLLALSRRQARNSQNDPSPPNHSEKAQLQKQTRELKSEIGSSRAENSVALRSQLGVIEDRLHRLETEGMVVQTIIQAYEPDVCLVHMVVGFSQSHYRIEPAIRRPNQAFD